MAKPIVLVVMDGMGIGADERYDMVKQANTPILDALTRDCPYTTLMAHGTAVGLPDDTDMGNSEVGHNALGCGQVYSQGAKLVNESIESGEMYKSPVWRAIIDNCLKHGAALHFIGLLSDANVHSNTSHLKAMIARAKEEKIKKVFLHVLLDGRDVPPKSALIYIDDIESYFAALNDGVFNVRIASGGGRMKVTMDRYQSDWNIVRRGWETHVHGEGRLFATATEAIETLRIETDEIDQFLPPFVIGENGAPVGAMHDDDGVILYNFRGDRAIQISMAFDNEDFGFFDRGAIPKVMYAGILQYDGDLKLPKNYLVSPPDIKGTLSELLIKHGLRQYAVSETQKYGHVTYFWNGNKSGKFDEALETFEEVPSDIIPFEQRPWMKSAQVADKVIEALESGGYDFIRCNFPNGDMVGHTGDAAATMIGAASVDLALGRIVKAVDKAGAVLLVTADHGNADEMFEEAKGKVTVKTAHTLNPVPFIIYDKNEKHELNPGSYGLANVAPTVAVLFGLKPEASWEASMVKNS